MPAFKYQAIDLKGVSSQGLIDADSARAARQLLREQGLVPLQVTGLTEKAAQSIWQRDLWPKKCFSSTQLAVWTRQLSGLVGAGLPLERTLSALLEDAPQRQRDLIANLRSEVNAGHSLAQAMAQHPGEFNKVYRAVIEAGEQSGQFDLVLERLAQDLEADLQLRSKVMAAALYPAVVSLVAVVIVLFLLSTVVPQVATVFQQSGHSLPVLTTVMLSISAAVMFAGWPSLLVLFLAFLLLRRLLKNQKIRIQWDAWWLNLPLLGRLVRSYNGARLANTLATLVGAGVPMLKALQTAADTLSNQALRADTLQALALVREGAPLGLALSEKGRMPALLPMFARLGEQTGQLPKMLAHAAEQLRNEVQRRSMQLATLLEPLLIVAMGVVVLLIVLSVMLPIIELNQLVR